MAWTPQPLVDNCFTGLYTTSCQPSFITFLTYVTHYFGSSNVDYRPTDEKSKVFDFIVVGAGSAGCVVANRLSEIKDWQVLLLEAGDEQPSISRIPGLSTLLVNSTIDFNYSLKLNESVCNDSPISCFVPSGKVMGGSSSTNGMIYVRGNKEDFNEWAVDGNSGWSWDDVLPYFKKSEDLRDEIPFSDENDHSTGGYLGITLPQPDDNIDVLINSWKELGYEEVDYNSGSQLGVGRMQYTIKNGIRQSTNEVFIEPIRKTRNNLVVRTNSQVMKIIIDTVTNKAIGVEYVETLGNMTVVRTAYAKKEVIVSAGTILSAKLLMLSGIGPVDELTQAGVTPILDLPVGRNLHDHVSGSSIVLTYSGETPLQPTFNDTLIQQDVDQWSTENGTGPMSKSGFFGLSPFLQTSYERRPGVPDIRVFYETTSYSDDTLYGAWPYYNQLQVVVTLVAGKSRGHLELNKTNPIWGKPLIYPNYFNHSQDIKALAEGMSLAVQFTETETFKQSNFTVTQISSPKCTEYLQSSEVEKYNECVARNYLIPEYSTVGTCKMGSSSDPQAVVDPRLRVRGIIGLRVVCAAIIPNITKGDVNAVAIMIGEKGSDLIKEDWLQ